MRKILRNMYRNAIPRRMRRKSWIDSDGKVIPGTWREWLKNDGVSKYLDAIKVAQEA